MWLLLISTQMTGMPVHLIGNLYLSLFCKYEKTTSFLHHTLIGGILCSDGIQIIYSTIVFQVVLLNFFYAFLFVKSSLHKIQLASKLRGFPLGTQNKNLELLMLFARALLAFFSIVCVAVP